MFSFLAELDCGGLKCTHGPTVQFRPPQCKDLSFKLFLKPLSSDICNQNGGPVDGADEDLPQG